MAFCPTFGAIYSRIRGGRYAPKAGVMPQFALSVMIVDWLVSDIGINDYLTCKKSQSQRLRLTKLPVVVMFSFYRIEPATIFEPEVTQIENSKSLS